MGVTFIKFPYPLERMTGTLDMNLLTRLLEIDVTGHTGGGLGISRPVFIKGTWKGEGQQADGDIDIHGTDIALDEQLVSALPTAPTNFQRLARGFNAVGKGDIKAHIRFEPGAREFRNQYHVRFHETFVRWDKFPYPLENVSGFLDIYPKHWEFRDGRGTHRGAEITVQGNSMTPPAKEGEPSTGLVLDITGRNLPLDDELHSALKPVGNLGKSWETFRPRGKMNFTARINQATASLADMEVKLDLRGGTIEPVFFPYALDDITGSFHFHKNKLKIRDAGARHQDAVFSLAKGTVDLHPEGGQYADLSELHVESLMLDGDMIQALPRSLRGGAAAFNLRAPVTVKARLVVAQGGDPGNQPDIYWDGQVWLRDATFNTGMEWTKVSGTIASMGRYNGRQLMGVNGNVLLDEAVLFSQPLRNLQANFQVKETMPDVMLLGLKGPIYGGDISGQARIDFNSTLRYELNLTGSQIDLREFGKQNLGASSQMQGTAMARLHLTGQGGASDTLDGHGSIDVLNARLYNLPLLLDLLKFLGLRWPDRTAFEELHALFSIHGKRVNMRKLEILGNAISLTGKGEFNYDGTDLALDFYPGWARLEQLLPPAVRPLPPAINKNLLTIEMRGKVSSNEKDRKFTMKPMPALVDPVLQMRDRLSPPAVEPREEPRMLPGLNGASK